MRGLLILLLFFTILILVLVSGYASNSNSSDPDPGPGNPPLPLTPISEHNPIIVVAPDGTVYIVENGSGKVLGSFSFGQSIYSSYQQIPNQEDEKLNASAEGYDFYIDCGEDWELYLHQNGLKKVKLPLTAEEIVKRTPFVSAGGGVMLGSKKTAVYLVDAKTGKVVRTFRSDNLPLVGQDETSSLARIEIDNWLPAPPADKETIEKPLYVTRTDYALKYTSMKTGKVLWYVMFADIEASYQCDGIENLFGGFPRNKKFGSGLHCETRPVVYRIRNRSSLEALFKANGILRSLQRGGVLSLPASDERTPTSSWLIPNQDATMPMDKLLAPRYSNENEQLLALPSSDYDKYMITDLSQSVTPRINNRVEPSSHTQSLLWPSVLWVVGGMAVAFFFRVISTNFRRQHKSNKTAENFKQQKVTSKKKKGRKSGGNRHSVEVGESRDDGSRNVVSGKIIDTGTAIRFLSFNPPDETGTCTDGRQIGRLIVTNKIIAKGSNGTIVLEGNYDGRSVAVKRLVRSHHSMAVKEIQNLIASDQHPNIVRWYGVEYDPDFVYICLERCTCNLYELILACTSRNQIITTDQDHEYPDFINHNRKLLQSLGSDVELQLWKANGHPSSWLLKLMRDIVCGIAHLHELGIVHRDLKPQNVLVIKDRSMSAKISDMGISKHLDREMSSLSKSATGSGSSGWQAPEQLRHERHTGAVDLFSLGCILFFCITGGKHPFGDSLERDINIVNDQKDLFLIDNIPEATNLISRLLAPIPNLRPTAVDVISHPLFWNSETRLSFLRDVSDRVELEDREDSSILLQALESIGKVAFGGKWDEKLDNAFINDIGRYRRYKFDSVRNLLRVIRNKLNHYGELSKEIQVILGPVPEGFDSYFSSRFPKLLMEVYCIIVRYCGEEETFRKYFSGRI